MTTTKYSSNNNRQFPQDSPIRAPAAPPSSNLPDASSTSSTYSQVVFGVDASSFDAITNLLHQTPENSLTESEDPEDCISCYLAPDSSSSHADSPPPREPLSQESRLSSLLVILLLLHIIDLTLRE
ncbi:hypothetical protein SBOR_6911 [Sclerotinia borealis F-4128]|uniref:Uncharacterized protein n=1 Tax=Sclerotinia borealis (strain F-4128) TaxID=1432307 RepID=W9CCZ7_SCLBF|nr:hypothetical protein SBOR_6911 [Sclerotinia borealis F-4128]